MHSSRREVGAHVLIGLLGGATRESEELVSLWAAAPTEGFANVRGDRADRVAKLRLIQEAGSRTRDQSIHIVDD